MSLIGSLAVSLLGNDSELKKAFDSTEKKLDRLENKMYKTARTIGNVGSSMTKLFTAPIAAAGASLFGLAKSTANAGDQIQKMAQRTGMSTESLSEYKHAAELSGTSIESLEKAVKRMQSTVYDAEQGLASSSRAIEELGLSVNDLAGLNPEQQFEKITMALAEVEDASKKSALAQDLFGKSGTDLLPMLNSGAEGLKQMREEAHELGIVFDQEAADASAQFNDDLDRLKKSFTGIFQELGKKLIPIFVDSLIPMIKETIIPMIKNFADKIAGLIEWFGNLSPAMQKLVIGFTLLVASIGPALSITSNLIMTVKTFLPLLPTLKLGIAALTGPIGVVIGVVTGLIAIWVLFGDEIKAFLKGAWELLINAIKAFVGWVPEQFAKIKNFFIDTFEKIKEFLQKFNLFEIGKNIIQSLINGIKSMIMKPVEMIKNLGNSIVNKFKSILGISSPSKVFAGLGEDITSGLQQGLDRTQKKLQAQVEVMVNGMIPKPAPAGAGGVSTRNDIQIIQNISDRASADYATNELVRKLKAKGVGGAFR